LGLESLFNDDHDVSDDDDPSLLQVKETEDLIEINLDKEKPKSFNSNKVKMNWEMASARKALEFKKMVERGEFIPHEVKKNLEDKKKLSEDDSDVGRSIYYFKVQRKRLKI